MSVLGLLLRTLLFSIIENPIIHFLSYKIINISIDPVIIGHNIALAAVIVIILFWNYLANRFWTYRDIKLMKDKDEVPEPSRES